LIKGLHFISAAATSPNTAPVNKGGAIRLANFQSSRYEPGSIDFDMTIESCIFEGFAALHEGGAISVINVRARLKLNHLIFQNNTALETYGGAMSIDTATDVVMNDIKCIGNRAKQFGGCVSVTSNSDDGAPSSGVVSQLHSMKDVSDRRGGSVYIGRSSLLTMTNSTTKDATGAGAIYVSSAKVVLSQVLVLDSTCPIDSAAIMCVSSNLKVNENSVVSGTSGRGLKGNGCALQVENVHFFQNTVVSS
jgi:hypothetical protein